MIWRIAKNEFRLHLMTFKFAVGTVVCLILTAVFMPILVQDYQQRLHTYDENVSYNEAELHKVVVYKNITPTIYRRPSVLAAFSQGLEKQLGNSATISYDKVPEIGAGSINHYMSIFSIFDASLVFKIVLSVLALLVAYDAVSGERERGTLRLLLSGSAARYQVLLGKLVAGLLVLVVPVMVAFTVGLVIALSFRMVSLTGADWVRVAVMFLASLVFVATIYNLGLLFSCLARRSAVSLVLGLFLWIVFVLVIPNGSVYLATQLRPVPPEDAVNERIALLRVEAQREFRKEFEASGRTIPVGDASTSDAVSCGGFGHGYIRSCNEVLMEQNLIRYGIGVPIDIKYAEKYAEVEYGHLRTLFEQRRLANNFARTSPMFLYESMMSALTGTDMAAFQHFIEGVRKYRSGLIEYMRARTDNFRAAIFFTPCTKEEMVTRPQGDDAPPLNLSDLPRFRYEGDLTGTLRRVVTDLGVLAVENLLFFGLAFAAFVRYDVR
jgi:ABC-type transport system involved in multi-copper enzyme maturation permease subunit